MRREREETPIPEAPKEPTILAGWKCEICGCTRSGWIALHDYERRYCRGIPRRSGYKNGEICGGNMIEINRGN